MNIGFVVSGAVLGLVTLLWREQARRRRMGLRRRFERDGATATAHVTAVWHQGRKGSRREIALRYADARGRTHEAETVLEAAEVGVLSVFPGARLEIHYFPMRPREVMVQRPQILDDTFGVSLVAAGAVFTLCTAIGALVS